MFIYIHMGSGPSPLSCRVFFPLLLLQAFLLLGAGCVPLLLRFPAGLFIYSSMRDSPSCLFSAQGTLPSLLCVFFVIAYYSVSLFSLGRGWSVQGAMLIWPRVVCGSTMLLSSPCGLWLPKQSGCWCLSAAWEPSWFFWLMWSGDAMHGLGVWRCQSFVSSQSFFLKSVSPASVQDFTLGSTLSASSL
jgi:hypothetical protein